MPAGKSRKQIARWKAQQANPDSQLTISASGIHSDDVGIFVTCDKGQENKCLREMNDLLSQYLEDLQDDLSGPETKADEVSGKITLDDIESEIQKELEMLKPSTSKKPMTLVKLDIPCVCFIKLGEGLDPVSLVHGMCQDAQAEPALKRSRFVKRMTPMSLMTKTMGGGLERLCKAILPPHFNAGNPGKKYAIRPTIRNNNALHRDDVIKTIASAIGSEHTVDLQNYDLLILVTVYRNVCGMSVVGSDYEQLKRFNLAEIYQPTLATQ